MIAHTSRRFDPRAAELGPLDVTRKSGKEGLIWAPSWQILKPALKAFKEATTAEQRDRCFGDYAVAYRNEMAQSWRACRDEWVRLLQREHLTLQCYCIEWRYLPSDAVGAGHIARGVPTAGD